MSTQAVITKLGPNDVLFGRGAPIVQTTGNIRFRDMVNANKAAYANTKCRQTKDAIARDIINAIDERGGRFLKEIKSSDDLLRYAVPTGTKAWIAAEYDEIVEKVKQTLRENEKNTAEKAPTSTLTGTSRSNAGCSIADKTSRTPSIPVNTVRGDQQLNDNDFYFPGQVQAPSQPQQQLQGGAISSSLLPLVQQHLVNVQQNQRRYQMQQELALSLQQQQFQNQVLAASIGTAADIMNGMVIPNTLPVSSHQASLGLGSILPSTISIEEYLFALRGRPAVPTEALAPVTGTVTTGTCTSSTPQITSIRPSNPYLTSVPPSILALVNNPAVNPMNEMLHRDAVLNALRRHRQQLDEDISGLSSSSSAQLVSNATTKQYNNNNSSSSDDSHRDIPTSAGTNSLADAATMRNGSDSILETPTSTDANSLEVIRSSVSTQPHREDPAIPHQSSTDGTNRMLQNSEAPITDSTVVHTGEESKASHQTTTTSTTTSTADTPDELKIPAPKKQRRDK